MGTSKAEVLEYAVHRLGTCVIVAGTLKFGFGFVDRFGGWPLRDALREIEADRDRLELT